MIIDRNICGYFLSMTASFSSLLVGDTNAPDSGFPLPLLFAIERYWWWYGDSAHPDFGAPSSCCYRCNSCKHESCDLPFGCRFHRIRTWRRCALCSGDTGLWSGAPICQRQLPRRVLSWSARTLASSLVTCACRAQKASLDALLRFRDKWRTDDHELVQGDHISESAIRYI